MSARIQCHVVTSIDPLRIAIGSHDEVLSEKLISAARVDFGLSPDEEDEDIVDYREIVDEYLGSPLPLSSEPGGWLHVIKRLVDVFGIRARESALAIEDDWHWDAMREYGRAVSPNVDDRTGALLAYFASGRPLRAKDIAYDGACYAWFDASELRLVHGGLEALDLESFANPNWLRDFHVAFVDSIKTCRKHCLILGAS